MQRYLAGINTILALLCASSQAEELTELDYLDDEPIIVSSATRLSQELQDVPASITVIDRQMIEASSAINLIELMRLVPGFQVGSIDGTESTATYHGLSSQHNKRLQILINGRSVYQSTFGGALWYSLPVSIDDISKIVVIRGPNAASYGANAFSAIVNITTFDASHEPGLKLGLLRGDRDTKRNRFSYSKVLPDTSFRITAEHESNTGYQDTYRDSHIANLSEPILPIHKEFPLYDDHFHRAMNLRVDHTSDSGSSHSLELGFKQLKFGSGYIDTLQDGTYEEVSPRDKEVDSHYINYTWEKSEGLLLTNQLRFSYNYVDQNDILFGSVAQDDLFVGSPFLPEIYTLDQSFRDRRLDVEFQQNRILSPELQTVWGLGLRYDETNSIGYLLEDSHSRYSSHVFGHVEWKQNRFLTWNAGGFLENHENIGSFFSPRLAVNLKPSKDHAFRANFSQAYRMPSFNAEYANSQIIIATNQVAFLGPDYAKGKSYNWLEAGNEQLEPEKMTSYELGYRGQFFNKKLDLDIRLAKENIKDIIENAKTNTGKNTPATAQFRWENYGEVDIDSAEIQLTMKPNEKTFFMLHASYANVYGYKADRYTDFNGDTTACPTGAPENAISCNNEPMDKNTPLLTTGVLVSHRLDNGLTISSQYNFHEAYRTGGDGDVLNTPFETLDIKFSKEWLINNNKTNASLTIRNVADEYYEDFENDNLVGREAYFQLEAVLF